MISEKVKMAKSLSASIQRVNDPADKLHFAELAATLITVKPKHLIEMSFSPVLDEFAEYVHRKQAYLKKLEAEMLADFDKETAETATNAQEWAKIKQLRQAQKENDMLKSVVIFISEMDKIIRSEVQQEQKDVLELLEERNGFEQQAQLNWNLYKSVANSEFILLKKLINTHR